MEEPGSLASGYFTAESVLSFGSSTLVVFVICNALQHAFSFNPRWLAFVLSQAIAMAATYAANGFGLISTIVGFVNGCLVYCTSIGATQISHNVMAGHGTPRGKGSPPSPHDTGVTSPATRQSVALERTFTTPWF